MVTGEEIVSLTEEWLTGVPEVKKNIKFIYAELEKGIYDITHVEKLKRECHKLNYKLSKIIRAISTFKGRGSADNML